MSTYSVKEVYLNRVIERCPAWIQIIFMERVIKSVKASIAKEKEENFLLLSKKEGSLREWRRYRPLHSVRTPRMDLLGLQGEYRQKSALATLHGRDGRTYHSTKSGWYSHMGQCGSRSCGM